MFELFRDRSKQRYEVGEFVHANSNLVIIVMDPKDDTIFVAHKGNYVGGTIKSPDGQESHVVKELIHASLFDKRIDGVLMAIMETLRIRRMVPGVNTILQFIDGALFNIARAHRLKKHSVEVPEGAQISPLSVADVVDPRRN